MYATRTVVVSLLVGTLVTVIAGLFPAIRATRVPPIAAVREGASCRRAARTRSRRTSPLALVALALLLLGYSMFADESTRRSGSCRSPAACSCCSSGSR